MNDPIATAAKQHQQQSNRSSNSNRINNNNSNSSRGRRRRGKANNDANAAVPTDGDGSNTSSINNNNNKPFLSVKNNEPSKRRRKGSIGDSDVCFQFARNGTCSRGDDCRFRHNNTTDDAASDGECLKDPIHNLKKTTRTTASMNRQQVAAHQNTSPAVVPTATIAATTDSTMKSSILKPPHTPGQQQQQQDQLRFADLSIGSSSKRALAEVFQYEYLTPVQAQTLPVILQGQDCLARAKTGTGKTLAFLIPTVETLLLSATSNTSGIACLVLSPNRELALQIHTEAVKLTKFAPQIRSAVVVGGTNINKDFKVLGGRTGSGSTPLPQILIATPGRLLDHLKNHQLHIPNLQVLIFDEFDQLLDQGFQPDLEKIMSYLTASQMKRQTLLFSATLPTALSAMAKQCLKSNHVFVDTVGEENEQTHLHVQQRFFTSSWSEQVYSIQALLAEHMASHPQTYKIIVFFTTARLTGFMAELFNSQPLLLIPTTVRSAPPPKILEIHSRKSQSARTKASDAFRAAPCAIMFSSDVSARGLDYPDVSFVLQVGLTERDQYIHRLGRSGRAGKHGGGALLCADEEAGWMKRILHDLPLQFCNDDSPKLDSMMRSAMTGALQHVAEQAELKESAEQAYRAWLGFYNGHLKKVHWDKTILVQKANQWSKDHGLPDIPTIQAKTLGKMGLRGVRGIKIEK